MVDLLAAKERRERKGGKRDLDYFFAVSKFIPV